MAKVNGLWSISPRIMKNQEKENSRGQTSPSSGPSTSASSPPTR